jgi:hypothetical protein
MKLTIPDVPPSPNRVLGKHWRIKAGEKDKWILLVRSQILPRARNEHDACPMQVAITLCHSRIYDQDNAYAAVKPVVDALKHWNLIWDDSLEWLDLLVRQDKCKRKDAHTIIELEPA